MLSIVCQRYYIFQHGFSLILLTKPFILEKGRCYWRKITQNLKNGQCKTTTKKTKKSYYLTLDIVIIASYLIILAALSFPSYCYCRILGSMLFQAWDWISHLSILTLIVNICVVKAVLHSGDTSLVASCCLFSGGNPDSFLVKTSSHTNHLGGALLKNNG